MQSNREWSVALNRLDDRTASYVTHDMKCCDRITIHCHKQGIR